MEKRLTAIFGNIATRLKERLQIVGRDFGVNHEMPGRSDHEQP
jgi:hypothetical protein